MTDLTPICALGAQDPLRESYGAYRLSERADIALASLAGGAEAPFGLTLPAAGGFAQSGDYAALWTGVSQWLIFGFGMAARDISAEISGGYVTEQTDAWAVFEIEGPALERLLEKLVNIDPQRLQTGMGLRTGFHHMSISLARPAPERLFILGMRSAAGSLHHALATALGRL